MLRRKRIKHRRVALLCILSCESRRSRRWLLSYVIVRAASWSASFTRRRRVWRASRHDNAITMGLSFFAILQYPAILLSFLFLLPPPTPTPRPTIVASLVIIFDPAKSARAATRAAIREVDIAPLRRYEWCTLVKRRPHGIPRK